MPDFETYFDIFHRNLKIDEGQTVHFELGRSLVAQCGELITRALYNKETSAGTKIVIVDAGMTDLIRPALYGAKHKIENLTSATGTKNIRSAARSANRRIFSAATSNCRSPRAETC